MTKQTGFNPDGNLIVRGSIFGDNDLVITGNANITGTLTVTGNTTLISDTVVQNNADGYTIDYNDNASSSYYQFGSAGARLSWDGANLTVALANGSPIATSFIGDVDFSNNITVTGTIATANSNISAGIANISAGNISASAFYGSTFSGTAENANYLTTNISLSLSGPISGSTTLPITSGGSFSNTLVTTLGNDSVTLGQHTTGNYVATVADAGNGNTVIAGSGSESAAVTVDLGDTTVTPGSYGNATATSVFTVDSKGRLSQANATQIAIPSSQVTDFQSAVRSNVSNSTGLDYNVSTGVFSISDTAVTATTYNSNASQVTEFTVNQQGQLTNAVTSAITITSDQVSDFNTAVSNFIADGVYITESNGTIDVSSEVVTTDRNDTLTADYTFTGNVDFSGASVTDANVAHLGGTETFTGDKTFTGNVDLSSATVVDARLVRTDTDATLANSYTYTGAIDLTGATATASTQANTDNSTKLATTEYVTTAISDLIDGAPSQLDTLREITDSLNNNATLANTLVASIAAAEANVVTVGNDRISKTGNIAMTGNLNLGTNYINNVVNPTQPQDAATKAYVDTANNEMFAYVSITDSGSNVRQYVDSQDLTKVNQTFTFTSNSLSFSHTGNITQVNSMDMSNSEIMIHPELYAGSDSLLIQGQAGGSGTNQARDADLVVRGNLTVFPGYPSDPGGPTGGFGTITSTGNIYHIKNSNANILSDQTFSSNVTTIFRKGDIVSSGSMIISGSNISYATPAGEIDTYLGSETTGTLNAQPTYSNVEVGVSRGHFQNFSNSTMFVGDFAQVSTYTNVYDLETESAPGAGDGNIWTTGGRPLERLTVDGAISLGARHTPANLLVNGTIFYDASSNKLKGIQGNAVVDLVDASVQTLDLGSGGDFAIISASGNTYYAKQLSAGTGIDLSEAGALGATVLTVTANADNIVSVSRGNISVNDISGDGSLAYNNVTGVFSYTGPSASEVRAHLSGGYGITYTSGTGVIETANADIRGLFSAGGDLAYNASTGVFSFTNDAGDIESVTAGAGLIGGGTSGAVTLDIVGGTGITVNADNIELTASGVSSGTYGNSTSIPTITVDSKGRVTNASQSSISYDNYSNWKFTTDTSGNVNVASGDLLSIVGDGNVNVTHSGNTITISSNADINSVVAGTGLTGGGSVGAVTLNLDEAYLANLTVNIGTTADLDANTITANAFVGGTFSGEGSDLTDVRAETIEVTLKNVSGGQIDKGYPVHATGYSGSGEIEVVLADAGNAQLMPAHFIALETLANGAVGRGLLSGQLQGVNTSTFNIGETIYVGVGGGYANVAPSGEGNQIQNLGVVTRIDASQGGGEVYGAGRSAATPNLNSGNIFVGNAQNQSSTADLSNFTYEIVSSANIETTANLVAQALVVNGNANVSGDVGIASDVIIEGNLTVNGVTTTISATTLSVDDNMIYLNANSNVTNPDLGFAGNYNDGSYAHAGFFRDTTDGYWKVFDGYTPEPDAAIDIDTSHASFNLADIRAGTFRGNLVVPGQYSLPTSDGTASQVLTTDGNGTVSFQSVSSIGLTSVTGGDGLTATPGIGSVDLDVGAGPGITVNADNVAVNVAYVRSQFSAGGDLSYSNGTFSFTERTNSEVRGLISATGNINYNSTTGVISESLTTTDITEGNNLYFTNARARSALSGGTGITYNSSTGAISLTDTGFISGVSASTGLTGGGTAGNVTLSLSHLGIEDLADPNDDRILFWDDNTSATGWLDPGTGLTITGASMTVNMGAFDTGDLAEGSNLYYTVARANSAIDARVTTAFVNALNVNATTLDTLDSTAFLRSNADDTHSSNIAPNATNTYSLGTSGAKYANVWATTFQGTATSAQYADLAEKYESDSNYECGTVVVFGGEKEITVTDQHNDHRVAGVISTNPAYMMNSGADGQYVALRGRVPCKVIGPIKKGDVLITSSTPGFAQTCASPLSVSACCIVGKALQNFDGTEGVIEVVV